jgi:hypothetical protein
VTRDDGVRSRMRGDALQNYFINLDKPDYCVIILEPCGIEYCRLMRTPEACKPARK